MRSLARPKQKVPVIRHHAIGKDPNARSLVGFDEHLLKGQIIARLLEERHPPHGTVENVIDDPSRRLS